MTKQTQPDEQDAPWKVIFRQYYREGMEFFFPIVAHEIDWTRPIEFLDKEFGKIAPDAATGKRFADMLVKVYLKRGTRARFLKKQLNILSLSSYLSSYIGRALPERQPTHVTARFDRPTHPTHLA